jgi:hypothetical protein
MLMQARIQQELDLLRRYYPDLEYREAGQWVLLPRYFAPAPWSPSQIPVCFQIPVGYAGTPPYGFYVPASLTYQGQAPNNASSPPNPPPFPGAWRILSWTPEDWRPTGDVMTGSNLWGWCRGLVERFRSGQ